MADNHRVNPGRMYMFYLFISSCFVLQSSCTTNGLISNPGVEDREVILLENDYEVSDNQKGYLTIKVLNENILDKLQRVVNPVIIININGDMKIAKGMTVIDSEIPLSCDYTFTIDIEKHTAIFDEVNLLILTSICNYKYLEAYKI
jgi:hypothetical protein